MACQLCEAVESNIWVLLPIKQSDGRLEIMACLSCAEESPAYCKKHQKPHLGFEDNDTTACDLCIEELILEYKGRFAVICDDLEKNLPEEQYNRLKEWADDTSELTGDYLYVCLLRALATKALRLKTSIDEIIRQMIQVKSVDLILPRGF